MIDCTRQLANIIINKVATMSGKFNRKNCRQCDAIVTEITSSAALTFVLVELQNCVDVQRSHSLGSLKVCSFPHAFLPTLFFCGNEVDGPLMGPFISGCQAKLFSCVFLKHLH